MIGYVCVGTNDWKRALSFYDALMAELGAKRVMDFETFVAWSEGKGRPGFALAQPFNKKPATAGNGSMTAFQVAWRVDAHTGYFDGLSDYDAHSKLQRAQLLELFNLL